MIDPASELSGELATLDAAYRTFETVRWRGTPRCAHCGSDAVTFLNPVGGKRHTRTGAVTARRVWKCATCHRQFSVLTGTVLHGTRIELTVWLAVIAVWADEREVPAPSRIMREHDVSRDAARHLHRLLVLAAEAEPVARCLVGRPG